ncbi:hypothetical protein LINGRAHAP2_LOCUS16584 [Linum grandiflorum]
MWVGILLGMRKLSPKSQMKCILRANFHLYRDFIPSSCYQIEPKCIHLCCP